MLRSYPRWDSLVSETGNDQADSLVQQIIDRSSGVFLWVTLVTWLLREGLTNDDKYEEEDYALGEPERMIATLQQRTSQAASVFRRVNGWCKGLLERNHDEIEFLHRTLYDFLSTPEMQ
ncbi:hypothetical protein QC761_0076170 [Podospora bellae-mahoneyi]|uniref:DUF7791 domain-containing protein n=1 Tax=Podospora bellae-mahoneyi TaxID=2093777 RepID=A0ABR0FCE7_9PEZI|nr:hypothetical protein QC761_0076170 [Podospora bellae-mahoneyi]